MNLSAGNYTLNAIADGTGASSCTIRVIENTPTDEDSFGGTALALTDGQATLSATLTEEKTFNYVWIRILSGDYDFSFDTQLIDDDANSFVVFNRGNIDARPILTLYGSGTINLSIDDVQLFTINLGSEEHITLDSITMNAYKGDVLKNRLVIGDLSKLVFKTGTNILSWTGDVSRVDVSNESRWI
jgi:hypothetical protein